MRSYFGGLLCVDWSPDSLFIVTGGQDDLITIWSVLDRAVICRGQGHKSWVSMVRFDPYLCPSSDDISHTSPVYTKSLVRNSPVTTVCESDDLRTYRATASQCLRRVFVNWQKLEFMGHWIESQWLNGIRAHLVTRRSWVRIPVGAY
ncbi:unnamed protein product [Trichobilharzia regenti]|nr:unnamed protein product [Trichobilharzia regenti]